MKVQIRVTTGSNELAGDTDLTSKYCTFIDWQQSQHCFIHFPHEKVDHLLNQMGIKIIFDMFY
ncbi:MAG: hypothetical protein ACJA2G_003614 [Cognaticolwellia sp.]